MKIKCHVCGSENITHLRQTIKNGRQVVTARCAFGHIPEKGKPFYPLYNFKIENLQSLEEFENELMGIKKPAPVNFLFPIEDM